MFPLKANDEAKGINSNSNRFGSSIFGAWAPNRTMLQKNIVKLHQHHMKIVYTATQIKLSFYDFILKNETFLEEVHVCCGSVGWGRVVSPDSSQHFCSVAVEAPDTLTW